MHSKKLLSLALSLFVAESVVASPCKPPSSASSSIASTTLSESTTTIISVSSTTDSETATESSEAETDTATTLATSTITTAAVDTTTAAVETSIVLIETSTASNEATTTSSETTTTAAEAGTTTAAEPFCAQTTVLANPTPFPKFDSEAEFGADDDYDSVTLPFPVGIFGSSSSTVYASTNGFLSLDSGSAAYENKQLPTTNAPPISIMPYWTDLHVPSNTVCGTGIAYEVHETSKGQTFTVEYYIGTPGTSPSSEHFTVSLYKDYPGLVRYVYYKTSGHGQFATVGLQNGNLFSQFSFNSAGSIPDQFFIEIDTSSGVAVTTSGQL
ncbi:hypothetical protein BKA59DRAFT_481179 [Fusarium tricinctum]|uniref:Uncharacterized protein n=1 Tax=Fusarium tricinctum TaxID=61284 RepID=A0A8K0RVQ3_9HYPO|nr:hypothetical protein BKA59DRAFT_481179 [Fusarium tricinctum]